MLKCLHAGCSDLSLVIVVQFSLEMCIAAENCKKTLKPPILRVEGHSRLSMLTLLRSLSLVHVCISNMCVRRLPICNRLYATRAISGKVTTLGGVLLFDVRLRRPT